MRHNQNPISSIEATGTKGNSKTFKQVTAGGLTLSVLTLGLWFGGAAQAVSPTALKSVDSSKAEISQSAGKLGKLNTEVRNTLQTMRSPYAHL